MKPPKTLPLTPTLDSTRYFLEQVAKILGGNVSFGSTTANTDPEQNIECWKATGTTPGTANTEFAVAHGLNRIPFGFLVVRVDAGAVLFKSTTAWSPTQIFLQSSLASVNYAILII